jgi:hypothetical protein
VAVASNGAEPADLLLGRGCDKLTRECDAQSRGTGSMGLGPGSIPTPTISQLCPSPHAPPLAY